VVDSLVRQPRRLPNAGCVDRRFLPLAEVGEQRVQRPVEDLLQVAVGNLVPDP
jgi:hypothetical protein